MVDHFMFAILNKHKPSKKQLYSKKKKFVCIIFLLNVLGQNFSELSNFWHKSVCSRILFCYGNCPHKKNKAIDHPFLEKISSTFIQIIQVNDWHIVLEQLLFKDHSL